MDQGPAHTNDGNSKSWKPPSRQLIFLCTPFYSPKECLSKVSSDLDFGYRIGSPILEFTDDRRKSVSNVAVSNRPRGTNSRWEKGE